MTKHITVIDVEIGSGKKGFAIRVGALNGDRHVGCFNKRDNYLVKNASIEQYSFWYAIEDAVEEAINLRNQHFTDYIVRVDCTI